MPDESSTFVLHSSDRVSFLNLFLRPRKKNRVDWGTKSGGWNDEGGGENEENEVDNKQMPYTRMARVHG